MCIENEREKKKKTKFETFFVSFKSDSKTMPTKPMVTTEKENAVKTKMPYNFGLYSFLMY